MKKCLSLLVAAFLMMSLFAACGEKTPPPTPYEAYQMVMERSGQATSTSMHLLYSVGISMGEQTMDARMEGDMQLLRAAEDAVGFAVQMTNNVPDVAPESATYYKDGVLYQDANGRKIRMETEPDIVLAQLGATEFVFEEASVQTAELFEVPEQADVQGVRFALSPAQTADGLWVLSQNILLSMGLPGDDFEQVNASFGDMKYEIVFDEQFCMKSAAMDFSMEITRGEETVSLVFHVVTDDVEFDTLKEVDYPDDLDSYGDMLSVLQQELDALNKQLATQVGYYVPYPTQYAVVNDHGEECDAAKLLAAEAEGLDYFFWLLYQTQTGVSAPVPPTGFDSPANLSAEGLLRLFCFANETRRESFFDEESETYTVPDDLPPKFLNGILTGYTYDAATLPEGYGHDSATSTAVFPLTMLVPIGNICRIDLAEITDPGHLKLYATGIAPDLETPVNTQEILIAVDGAGQPRFESYSIQAIQMEVPE